MTKYRISVSFDRKNFFWIVAQDGRIIYKNPIKENLYGTKLMSYNKTNICPICREESEKCGAGLIDKNILYPGNANKERKKDIWMCKKCYDSISYYGTYEKPSRNKYKINVSFDENNFFWIVTDNGKFIRNPTVEDLKYTKILSYNKTNTCPMCIDEYKRDKKELTDKIILYPGNTKHDIDKEGRQTDEWVCNRHNGIHYQNSNRKPLTCRRTGSLTDLSNVFGDNCEELTNRWLGTERLSVKYDNYRIPFDHSPVPDGTVVKIGSKLIDLSGKILQTQGRRYNKTNRLWHATGMEREWYKEFDYLIIYCAGTDKQIIERIYFIPKKNIYDPKRIVSRISIAIVKNPTNNVGHSIIPWYEKCRIIEEEILIKVNEIWRKIIF